MSILFFAVTQKSDEIAIFQGGLESFTQVIAMNRSCIIGDIHGCFNSLVTLLAQVENRVDTIVFLGDYVDRGPDSKQVVELILQLKKKRPHVITLLGNHEYMLLNYLAGLDDSVFLKGRRHPDTDKLRPAHRHATRRHSCKHSTGASFLFS